MKKLVFIFICFLGVGFAQDYSGTFVQQEDVTTVMTLQAQNEGYTGTFLLGGTDSVAVEASLQDGYLAGYLRGTAVGYEDLFFVAELTTEGLNFMVAPIDEQANPIESAAEAFVFVRQGNQGQTTNPLGSSGLSTQNPLSTAIATDLFSGDYEGQAFNLSLQATATGYSGSIVMNGQSYPVQAQATANQLSGYFSTNAQNFEFQAELVDTVLSLVSDGQTYTLTKSLSSQNPLATSSSPIIAKGSYADLTEDNALAVFEAYAFSLEQLGYTQTLGEVEKQQFMTFAVQEYPLADQETQLSLSRARDVWTQVQQNWGNASLEEQRGFVLAILSLVHGEEAVQQNLAQSARSGDTSMLDSLGCSSVDSCMQTLNPEGYEDMVNAQNCWAGAGCESYDAESNTFYEEPDYSYDIPVDYGD